MNSTLAWITWNPSREFFRIPYFDHPVTWYGCFFALGFLIGFVIMAYLFRQTLLTNNRIRARDIANWDVLATKLSIHVNNKAGILEAINGKGWTRLELEKKFEDGITPVREQSLWLTDKITWFIIIGTVIGARLGHVFFYDWPQYKDHLVDILKIWHGGLASHGGAIGVFIAILLFRFSIRKNYPEFTMIRLMDMVAIPTALAGFCIRIGNFMNQEILGVPSSVSWAIIFKNPIDGGPAIPRHPAQLYEALAYLATFALLFFLWKKKGTNMKPGLISGLFFILVFGSRFLIEYIKTPLSMMMDESFLHAGQLLSIPFIIFGLLLCFFGRYMIPPHYIAANQ